MKNVFINKDQQMQRVNDSTAGKDIFRRKEYKNTSKTLNVTYITRYFMLSLYSVGQLILLKKFILYFVLFEGLLLMLFLYYCTMLANL